MDTLMRTKKLEDLGFERPKAEGLVLMVKESIDEEVAKKADLERVETSLRTDLERVETSLRTDLERVETSLRTDLERVETSLRTELKLEIANVRSDIKVLSRDLMLKLGALMITMTGIIIGVLSLKKVPASSVPPSPDSSLSNYKLIFLKMTPFIDLLGLRIFFQNNGEIFCRLAKWMSDS